MGCGQQLAGVLWVLCVLRVLWVLLLTCAETAGQSMYEDEWVRADDVCGFIGAV